MEWNIHRFFSSQLRLILTQLTRGESSCELSSPLNVAEALVKCYSRIRGVADTCDWYLALLVRKIILTHLKVLCSSKDIFDDVPCGYEKCKDICLAIRQFNSTVSFLSRKKYVQIGKRCSCRKVEVLRKINLYEIVEICTDSRARAVSVNITNNCSLETIMKLVKYENSFIMALLELVMTLSSVLDPSNSEAEDHLDNKPISEIPSSIHIGFPPTESINLTWKDYVSDNHTALLKPLLEDTFRKLWKKIARNLSCWTRGHLEDGLESMSLLSALSGISFYTGWELYPEVVNCLQSTALLCSVQSTLHKWDAKFQGILANDSVMRQKGYKGISSSLKSQEMMLSQVCEDLYVNFSKDIEKLHHDLKKNGNILLHFEIMKEVSVLSSYVQMVLHHISATYLLSIGRNMHQWNLPNLAWLISCGTPALCSSIKKCVAMVQYTTCPRLSFPLPSFFHHLERQCQTINESIHHSFMFIKEVADDFSMSFYNVWNRRSLMLVQSHFPSVKQLKKAIKGGGVLTVSQYCNIVTQELFAPMVKGAASLTGKDMCGFIDLVLTIFYNVLRKTITTNKGYLVPPVADQMLVDLNFLQNWLTHGDRQLPSSACDLIQNLPIAMEMRGGLEVVSGRGREETDDIAWNSANDWIKL